MPECLTVLLCPVLPLPCALRCPPLVRSPARPCALPCPALCALCCPPLVPFPALPCAADATVELPADLARKHHKPKPHIPSEYRLERPISKPESPDQDNPIVFYDVW